MSLQDLHARFLDNVASKFKLTPTPISILPTVIFATCSFALLHWQLHQRGPVSSGGWKGEVFTEIAFHCAFFYTTRLWFALLKFMRWFLDICDAYVEANSLRNEVYINKMSLRFCAFTIVLGLSLLPAMAIYVKYAKSREVPDILIWVAEDPWLRSEIGSSGHYLERPPPMEVASNSPNAVSYRSRRSSSVDATISLMPKQSDVLRPCRSLTDLRVTKSIEDVIG
ncbi:uncharacterized protein LOC132698585 [Cylas formicarius]|uniref:uncharacterized protein LOC132698585 n=1 Tax=Cylas formicarius TaxID=197179 RepID=UPI00295879A2|nr:uncharacterized protein LOC132698585 [Cylas formicarius]